MQVHSSVKVARQAADAVMVVYGVLAITSWGNEQRSYSSSSAIGSLVMSIKVGKL